MDHEYKTLDGLVEELDGVRAAQKSDTAGDSGTGNSVQLKY